MLHGRLKWDKKALLEMYEASLKLAFRPVSFVFIFGVSDRGKALRIETGSIFSVRHTLDARARTKKESGKLSYLSDSSASSFLIGTLSETANMAMCKPWASRAARNIAPALDCPSSETIEPIGPAGVFSSSLIESTTSVG